jgi:hypothetical protein
VLLPCCCAALAVVLQGYLGVFRRTLANKLQVKPNEVSVNSVTCNNAPVKGAAGAPAALGASLPRPAHKRMLLQELSGSPEDPASGSNMRLAGPSNASATLATVFQVPAPADPAERAKLAADLKQGAPDMLTGPLSEFFGKPVTVLSPQQLQDPARKPGPPAEVPRKPRGLPLTPPPALEPPPAVQVIETEIAEEVPVQVITEIPGRNATAPAAMPQPSPKPKAVPKDGTEDSEETPTLSLQLPKKPKTNATKPLGALPANKTLPSPLPAPVKLVLWANAPQCKGKPDGQNSVPGEGLVVSADGDACMHACCQRALAL